MNTAYALFDKGNEHITFKFDTTLTSNLDVYGLSTLSNLTVPVTATINTANITTANVTTGNITTLNSTNATLSNIINNSFTGNVATLSNLTVFQTTNTSNLIGTIATLSNIYSSNVYVVNAVSSETVQTTSTIRSGDYVRATNEMRIAGTTATLRMGNQSGPPNQESQYNAVKAVVTSGAFATLNINADNQFNQIITTVPTGGYVDNQCLTQTNTLNVVSNASIGGNLGIGVTGTPTNKLEIVGNTLVTGDTTNNGNIYARNMFKKNYVMSDTRVNSTTYTVIPALTVPILAGYTYAIRGVIWWKPLNGDFAGGARFKFTLNDSITFPNNVNGIMSLEWAESAVTSGQAAVTPKTKIVNFFSDNNNNAQAEVTIPTTLIEQFYCLKFHADICIDDTAPNDEFKVKFRVDTPLAAPNQNVREVRVYEGSYIEYQYLWNNNQNDGSYTTLW